MSRYDDQDCLDYVLCCYENYVKKSLFLMVCVICMLMLILGCILKLLMEKDLCKKPQLACNTCKTRILQEPKPEPKYNPGVKPKPSFRASLLELVKCMATCEEKESCNATNTSSGKSNTSTTLPCTRLQNDQNLGYVISAHTSFGTAPINTGEQFNADS